jgi:hypothetical protein
MSELNSENVSQCASINLSQNSESGSDCPNLTQTAKAMAAEHQLSLRTAYRHLARGTTPSDDRRIGMDGKTYPARPRGLRPKRTSLERELALTWQALNRADKNACQNGITDNEVVSLRRIVSTAAEMLNRWEGVQPATSGDHGL